MYIQSSKPSSKVVDLGFFKAKDYVDMSHKNFYHSIDMCSATFLTPSRTAFYSVL